jgi:hypothetical protein
LKTFSMQFITKNSAPNIISCNTNEIVEVSHLKFLGLEIYNALSWNIHTDSVINKLTTVCFMIRSVRPSRSHSLLLKIYYSLFHSIFSYGSIFWGQATYTKKLFLIPKKKTVHLITGYGNMFSCRYLFRQLGILPFKSQYIYSVLLFVLKNRKLFATNYDTQSPD